MAVVPEVGLDAGAGIGADATTDAERGNSNGEFSAHPSTVAAAMLAAHAPQTIRPVRSRRASACRRSRTSNGGGTIGGGPIRASSEVVRSRSAAVPSRKF